jgi:HEAT repeat protein/beta-lactamase regulating signal transducer with metallopeptidase domain
MIPADSWSFAMLADISMRVTLVLALAWLGARLTFQRSASARHAMWAAAFIAVLALPLAAGLVPAWSLPLLPAPAAVSSAQASPRAPAPVVPSRISINLAAPKLVPLVVPEASRGFLADAFARLVGGGPYAWALLAWGAVAGALVLRYLMSLAAVAALTRRAATVHDRRWLDALDVAAASLGIVRTPPLVSSSETAVPFTCGFIRPTLVVPASATTWNNERIRVVLLHELAHVARRDCLVQAITQTACAIYWFHPLAWIGARHLRAERERACDDLVLASGTRNATYAEHLLDIARSAAMASSGLATAALAMAKPSELEGRLLAILDPRRDRARVGRRRVWQVALAGLAIVLPLASVRVVARAATLTAPATQSAPPAQTSSSGEAEHASTVETQKTESATATRTTTAVSDPTTANVVTSGGPIEGVVGGVRGGVAGGVSSGIAGGVARGIGVGVATGLAESALRGGRFEVEQDGEQENTKPLAPAVLQALMEALKDTDAEVRKSAMQALARFRSPAAFDAFVVGLKDHDPDVRQQAAFALSQLRDPRATDALVGALKDENADVRQQAAFALSQLRTPAAVPALTAALKDPDDDVREQALFALSQIRDPSSVPALMGALSDSKANVRQQAAFALSQLGDDRAIPALIGALKDKEPEVREQAAFALSQIGNESAIEPLTAAIKDPVAQVRQQAIFALSQLAGGDQHRRHELAPWAVVAPSPRPTPAPAPTPATPPARPR